MRVNTNNWNCIKISQEQKKTAINSEQVYKNRSNSQTAKCSKNDGIKTRSQVRTDYIDIQGSTEKLNEQFYYNDVFKPRNSITRSPPSHERQIDANDALVLNAKRTRSDLSPGNIEKQKIRKQNEPYEPPENKEKIMNQRK